MITAPIAVRGVTVRFPVRGPGRRTLQAVAEIDLEARAGEILGIVGESGSGKSTLGRCMLGLLRPSEGHVEIDGRPIVGTDLALRRMLQPVFQDAYGSLDPRWTVRRSVRESLDGLRIGTSRERDARVAAVLEEVGLGAELAERLPGALSGGQRQRVGIAAALASRPRILVADEPVSALDVSVQAQVLNLLARLRDTHGLTLVLITHDLSVVEHLTDRMAVMYLGRIVEVGPTARLLAAPAHPYTRALIASAPRPDPRGRVSPTVLAGEIPSPIDPPSGCAFHTRCPLAFERCRREPPRLMSMDVRQSRHAACHLAADAMASAPGSAISPSNDAIADPATHPT